VARKLVDYSDSGSTMGAVNFPQVQLPTARRERVHPGSTQPAACSAVDEVLARHAVNIAPNITRPQ